MGKNKGKNYSLIFWLDVVSTGIVSISFLSSLMKRQKNLKNLLLQAVSIPFCMGCTLFAAKN